MAASGLTLRPYNGDRVEDVVEVYNRGIAGLPYCCSLDVAYFASEIASRFFFIDDGLLLAYRRGRPVGYVHATFAPSADRQDLRRDAGTITALFFPPSEPATGAALLAAAEDWLAGQGARRVIGWGSGATGYPFYRGLLSGLEPVLVEEHAAVVAAFRDAGYMPYVTSFLLEADFTAPLPETRLQLPVETAIAPRQFGTRWDQDSWRGHQPIECRATVDGTDTGRLLFASLPRLSGESGTMTGGIAALGVPERFRRQGIASLLLARSLNHLLGEGVRRCLVACHRDNVAALAAYRKFGFRRAALMVGMEKALAAPGAGSPP